MSEVQLDWFIVPKMGPLQSTGGEPSSDGTVEVLLVAVHNDELSLLQKVVADAELSASFYEIEIFSTIRAVVDEPVKPVMVLDVGAASTKMYVIERGIVALSHAISTGESGHHARHLNIRQCLYRGGRGVEEERGPRRRWRARLPGARLLAYFLRGAARTPAVRNVA